MNITSTFLSFFLALSASAIISGESEGLLSLRTDASSNVLVSACSPKTVTVEGNKGLKPGFIIAQIDSDKNNKDDKCSFLFRKIASSSEDGTYDTILATFSDIFPAETYDATLADTSVESMFQSKDQKGFHRTLQDASPTSAPTAAGGILCEAYPIINTIVVVITPLSLILPFLLPVIPFLVPAVLGLTIYLAATSSCGVTWDNVFETFLGDLRSAGDYVSGGYAHSGNRSQATESGGDRSLSQMITFQPSFDEWNTISSNGECHYVECNVGLDGNASDCFSKDLVTNNYNFGGMINMEKVIPSSGDIVNAFSARDYCYASSFDKDTCDSTIFDSLVSSCSGSTASHLTAFPLGLAEISNDCLALSLLFHLGTQKFGSEIFEEKQMTQMKYSKGDVCNQLITTQM